MAEVTVTANLGPAEKAYEDFLRRVGSRPVAIPLNTVGGGGFGTTAAPPSGAAVSTGGASAWVSTIGMGPGMASPATLTGGFGMAGGSGFAASNVQQAAQQFAQAAVAAVRQTAAQQAAASRASTAGMMAAWADQERGTPYRWADVEALGRPAFSLRSRGGTAATPPPGGFYSNFMTGFTGAGKGEGAGGYAGDLAAFVASPMSAYFTIAGGVMNAAASREAQFRPAMARTYSDYLRGRAAADYAQDTIIPGSALAGSLLPSSLDPLARRFEKEARAERYEMRRESAVAWNESAGQENLRRMSEYGDRAGGEYGRGLAEQRASIQNRFGSQRTAIDSQITELGEVNDALRQEARGRMFGGLTSPERQLIAARNERREALADQRQNLTAQEQFELSALERADRFQRQQQWVSGSAAWNRSFLLGRAAGASAYDRPIATMRAELEAFRDTNREQEAIDRRQGRFAPEILDNREAANRQEEAYRQALVNNAVEDRRISERYTGALAAARFTEATGIIEGQSQARAGLAARRQANAAEVQRFRDIGDNNRANAMANVFSAEERAAEMQVSGAETRTRAGLAFDNERLRILTNDRGGRFEERARQAQTTEIVRQTQLSALDAANAGQAGLIPGIMERGRLQLRAQQQQYLSGFRAMEVGNISRIATDGNPSAVLAAIRDAQKQLGERPDGTNAKPITADEMRQIMNDAIDRVSRTR